MYNQGGEWVRCRVNVDGGKVQRRKGLYGHGGREPFQVKKNRCQGGKG